MLNLNALRDIEVAALKESVDAVKFSALLDNSLNAASGRWSNRSATPAPPREGAGEPEGGEGTVKHS